MMRMRDELPGDRTAIHQLIAAAFSTPEEPMIMDLARERGQITWSIVAEEDDAIIGHVLLTPMTTEPDIGRRLLGLGPISVRPDRQRTGIGSALMQEAIGRARESGYDAILLLGNPLYYHRFGFATAPIGNEYGATDAFMALELVDGALANAAHSVARNVSSFADADRLAASRSDTRQ